MARDMLSQKGALTNVHARILAGLLLLVFPIALLLFAREQLGTAGSWGGGSALISCAAVRLLRGRRFIGIVGMVAVIACFVVVGRLLSAGSNSFQAVIAFLSVQWGGAFGMLFWRESEPPKLK
jgi:hypothetical protein